MCGLSYARLRFLDGDQCAYFIDFSDRHGEQLRVAMPAIFMWNFLPAAYRQLSRFFTQETSTSFFRIVKAFKTSLTPDSPFVCAFFDNDQPVALTSDAARQLAEELIKLAEEVEARPQTKH